MFNQQPNQLLMKTKELLLLRQGHQVLELKQEEKQEKELKLQVKEKEMMAMMILLVGAQVKYLRF